MKLNIVIVMLTALMTALPAMARDDNNRYSIANAMEQADAQAALNRGYVFKFGDQPHGKVVSRHGNFMSNKKARAFAKSDESACQRAFLNAMLSFQDRIEKEGGNAVINIKSFYKKHSFVSATEYECGNGAIMAGVTFTGDVVTLEN